MAKIFSDGKSLTIKDVVCVAREMAEVALTDNAVLAINHSREYVEKLVNEKRTVYGVTTGFGEFSKVSIPVDQVAELQRNLIVSHACGVGRLLPIDVVRAMMLLRVNALATGFSGIRLSVIQTLIDMLNAGITPAVPEKGSLGASGDLTPLSHMVLPLIGLGEAFYQGKLMPGGEAMAKAGIKPVELVAKEGLALVNGTQAMTAIGALTTYDAGNLMKLADISAALTTEALNGITDAYSPALHALRPHIGQMTVAGNMLKILADSQMVTHQSQLRVQDAYSLRCVPQIHGASRDALSFVEEKLSIEINSVTDNPIIFADDDMVVSGGNFHGQPVALAFDFLAIALSEIANVAERRIERLVNPTLSGLPAFLTKQGGLNSGFMIAQYSAAALVSENKILAHPASVDSIPSSAGQEDHVSMGTIGARKAAEVLFNVKKVIAIEMVTAAQAIDLNPNRKELGKGTGIAYEAIRQKVSTLESDRELYLDFEKISELVDANTIVDAVEHAIGQL